MLNELTCKASYVRHVQEALNDEPDGAEFAPIIVDYEPAPKHHRTLTQTQSKTTQSAVCSETDTGVTDAARATRPSAAAGTLMGRPIPAGIAPFADM